MRAREGAAGRLLRAPADAEEPPDAVRGVTEAGADAVEVRERDGRDVQERRQRG